MEARYLNPLGTGKVNSKLGAAPLFPPYAVLLKILNRKQNDKSSLLSSPFPLDSLTMRNDNNYRKTTFLTCTKA